METAGKLLLVSAFVLAIVGLGALGLAKLGVDRVPGTLSWKSGWSLIAGKVWGGLVAIALASLSAIANFFMIPYYPFWSIVIIAICMWVIWAVTRPGVYRTP